jgi:hypothetical protein
VQCPEFNSQYYKKKKVHWAAVETQGYLKELPEIVPELRISLAQAAKM